jgi:hypothetical protein
MVQPVQKWYRNKPSKALAGQGIWAVAIERSGK